MGTTPPGTHWCPYSHASKPCKCTWASRLCVLFKSFTQPGFSFHFQRQMLVPSVHSLRLNSWSILLLRVPYHAPSHSHNSFFSALNPLKLHHYQNTGNHNFYFLKTFFYQYECLSCMYIDTPRMFLVPEKVQSGLQVPQNGRYR